MRLNATMVSFRVYRIITNLVSAFLNHTCPSDQFTSTGQLETTKLLKFCRFQNLRTLFSEVRLPPEIHSIITSMETRFKVNVPEYQLLLECLKTSEPDSSVPRKMLPLKSVDLLGHHFEASPSKNSCVMVRLSDSGPFAAVTIQSIFSHTRRTITGSPVTQKFVKIQPFESLSPSHSLQDLYRQFPFSGGRLYYNRLRPETKVVSFESIVVHFGQTPMLIDGVAEECLHALPLPRT